MKTDFIQFVDIYQILIILGMAVAVVSLLRPLKLSPVLGYLLAGTLIGPFGLGLIDNVENTRALAEFGVVFLLFTVGLELPIERLRVMRRLVFGLGGLQVFTTSLVIGLASYMFLGSIESAIIIGGALALSSTAMVLQMLVERGELSTQYGRASFSTVLFQDLAVVPLIVIIPLLGHPETSILSAVWLAIANAVLVITIVFLAGRLFMRPLFKFIDAKINPELFTATSLLVVLATAALSYYFGLSMALGAFLAGILLAESEYRHQVAADIQPFRGLLLGLFFMTVGMTIDSSLIIKNLGVVTGLVLAIMLIKGLILFGLARLFGKSRQASTQYALMLGQSGEFAFVLLGLAFTQGILSDELSRLLFLVVAISMALTPLLVSLLFSRLQVWLPVTTSEAEESTGDEPQTGFDRVDHVIIAGYGRVGRTVARVLDAETIPFVAIDIDHGRVAQARARKRPVFYGDVMRLPGWRSIGAEKARAVVIAIEKPALVSRIVALLRKEFPHLKIFVRAQDADHAKELIDAGATDSIPITFQASLELGASVLKSLGQSSHEVTQVINFLHDRYEDDDLFKNKDEKANDT